MFRLTPGTFLAWAFGYCLLFPVLCLAQQQPESRQWTDNTGKFKIVAEFIEVKDGKVRLRRADNGKVIAVPLDRLSDVDRQFLTDMNKPAEDRPKDPKPEASAPKDPKSEASKSEDPKPAETQSLPATPKETETKPPVVPEFTDSQTQPGNDPGSADSGELNMQSQPDANRPPVAEIPKPVETESPNARPIRQGEFLPNQPPTEPAPKQNDVTESAITEPMPTTPVNRDTEPPAESTTQSAIPGNPDPNNNGDSQAATPHDLRDPKIDTPSEADNGESSDTIPSEVIPFRPKREPDKSKKESNIPRFSPDSDTENRGSQNADLITLPEQPESGMPEESLARAEPHGRYMETSLIPIVNGSRIQQEMIAARQEWTTMSDAQLAAMLQLSGNLTWKGKAKLLPSLKPNPPNYELVIGARGAELLESVSNAGFVEFETVVDDTDVTHEPVALPPRVANPLKGWVGVRRGAAGKDGIRPVFINVEFPRPKTNPNRIRKAQGQFKLRLATEHQVITVNDVPETNGKIDLPSLAEKGMEIHVTQPDALTVVVRIGGNPTDVADVMLMAEEGSFGVSQMTLQDSTYYQFNFISQIPRDLDLKIRLVNKAREITLPFEFANLLFTKNM